MALPSGELHNTVAKEALNADLKRRMEVIHRASNRWPTLGLLLANKDHAPSVDYVKRKVAKANQLGIRPDFRSTYTAANLPDEIEHMYSLESTCGIVVQLPFIDEEAHLTDSVLEKIDPSVDIDALRGENDLFDPATPKAILTLLESNGVDLLNERILLVGKGRLVGEPLLRMLTKRDAEVAAIDIETDEVDKIKALDEADIIITAVGKPGIITPDLFTESGLRKPRVLVDVGAAEQNGETVGDASGQMRAAALENGWGITPHRGGVGPLTVLSIMSNLVTSAERKMLAPV